MAKKIFSFLVACVMIFSFTTFAAFAQESDMVLFGVFSDTHNNAEGIANVFNNIYALSNDGEDLDGVVMNGDIVYMQQDATPAASHYANLLSNEKYQELKAAGKLVYEMGNHEFPLNSQENATLTEQAFAMFKEQTGFDTQMHTVMAGYHFINAAPENYSGGMQVNEEYMRAELDKALADGTEKPVFLVVHHPVPSSVIDSPSATSTRFSVEFREYLNSQPRIVVFSGHTHEPETDPRSIRQYIGGCTYVATSHVAGGSNVSSSYASQSHSKKVTQAMMMEIDPETNVVTFKRFYVDKTAPQYLETEDWVIDIPAMIEAKATETDADDLAAYKYTFEDRNAKGVAPFFEAGSQVVASNIAAESVKLTFPKAIEGAAGEDNLIKFYEMKIFDLDSAQVVKTEAIISDYFLKESERRQQFSHNITGLSQGTSYKIEVMATTSWYKKSAPISVEFQTLEKEKFETVTLDAANTFTVAAENISNDKNVVYHRGAYIQVPNTASNATFTATFNLTEKGMYRFMSGSLGSNGAPVKAVIRKVEENGEKTLIKTAEVYVATGDVNNCVEIPFADVPITEAGTYTLTWSRGESGDTATLKNLKVGKFAPLPVEYLDEYTIEKSASEYLETSETVEEGTVPESFTLNSDGFVTWEIIPDYTGRYTLSYDFEGTGVTTVESNGMTISGETISALPENSEITADGLTVYLFENVAYKFTFKASSDNTIVNGMGLIWHEDFMDIENESYKFTYGVNTDLAYGNYNNAYSSVPAYAEKTFAVPLDANYTFSINAGLAKNITLRAFIARVAGQSVSVASTGAIDTVANRVIFTDVPLKAGVTYKITFFNATSSSTIRIQDVCFETSGAYLPDVDDLVVLANDRNSLSTGIADTIKKKHVMGIPDDKYISFKLKPGAGNYKIYGDFKQYTNNPDVRVYLDGTLINTLDNKFTGTVTTYELGTIRVSDDEFTLRFEVENTSATSRIWFYRFRLKKIDEPVVVMYKGQTAENANITTEITEGSLTTKAYLPKEVNGTPVTMILAVYEDNRLYKIGTYSLTGKKNSITVATVDDIAFEEGKNYTTKVLFINSAQGLTPLYDVLSSGCISGSLAAIE